MFENRPESKAHRPWHPPLHGDEHAGNPLDVWQRRSPHAAAPAPAESAGPEHHTQGLAHAPAEAAQVMAHYGADEEAEQPAHAPPEPAATPLEGAKHGENDEHESRAGHDSKAEHGEDPHAAGSGDAAHKQQDPVEAAGAEAAQREAGGDRAASASPSSESEHAHGPAEHEAHDAHEGPEEHAEHAEHAEHEGHAEHAAADGHDEAEPAHDAHAAPHRAALRAAMAAPAAGPAPTPAAPSAAPRSGQKPPTFAKVDRYNPTLASNPYKDKKHQLQRPGIRVKGRDKFKVKGGAQLRYLITDDNQVKVADRVTNKSSSGKTNDIAINIAHTRKLVLEPGKPAVECVLVFVRGRGAAWMPMDGLDTGTDRSTLRKKVNDAAKKHQPHRVPTGTSFKRYTFVKKVPPSGIDDDYIQPNRTHGADMVEHYLKRTVDTGLGRFGGPNKRSYYNVSLNLPQKKAPPTAVDSAEPGAPFFVAQGKEFERQVSVFGEKKSKAKGHFAWVFGYLGKKDGTGWVPDEARRGWVPKRCLE
ncbi:MAG: hypothetical protein U1A78_32035 [Polyangia bacterium]